MMMWLFAAAAGASLGLTWALRRYALARYLVDVPNERSSHRIPTPRGGGMAIVLTFLGCLPVLSALGFLPLRSFAALSGSGGVVALIGFMDDHYHVSRRWRLLVHLVAVIWALLWLGGAPALRVADFDLPRGWLSDSVAAVWMLWVVNLYNFMDGIDGIASIEALTLCAGGMLLYVIVVPGDPQWTTLALLMASVAGFLFWNYPPARIFMGDAGSGFLGMVFAVSSIQAAGAMPNLFWAWAIMLGVFVVDASVTLVRRIFRGGGTYLQAHRNHAYQYAARRFGMHKPVSLTIGAINVVWLCPLAIAVGLGYLNGALGLLLAYLPLVGLALHFKAGAPES